MKFKFIHAADLHIDSPMKGLRAVDDELGRNVRTATRDAFKKLIDLALKEDVSFIVVAGDIFDGDWDNVETGKWTLGQLKRLEERDVPVYVVFGNHDRKNKIVKKLAFPSNVKIFDHGEPQRFVFPENAPESSAERVVLTGQSYGSEKCPRDLARSYPDAAPNAFNIGVLHTSLGGANADDYAPTTVDELLQKGYDYWALGHVHQGRVAREANPWIGYSGVLQARHINEEGAKGCYLVEIEDGRLVRPPRFVEVDVLRWTRVDVDCSLLRKEGRSDDESGFESLYKEKMNDALGRSGNRPIAVRVRLLGRTACYRELRDALNDGELRDRLEAIFPDENLYLEEILWEVRPLRTDRMFSFGVLRSIVEEFAELDAMFDKAIAEGRDMSDPEFEPIVKMFKAQRDRLTGIESDLRGDVGGVGVDMNDPALYKRWFQNALEILRDRFCDD